MRAMTMMPDAAGRAAHVAVKYSGRDTSVLQALVANKRKEVRDCGLAAFRELDWLALSETAIEMLTAESEIVRQLGAFLLSEKAPPDQVSSALDQYQSRSVYYYNVVVWLDRLRFGAEPFQSYFRTRLDVASGD